jgi:hypothetical protein
VLTWACIDNVRRRDRAQQRANDCQSAQDNYKKVRAQIAATLAPVRAEIQPVLKALGCVTLEDLDKKVFVHPIPDSMSQAKVIATLT